MLFGIVLEICGFMGEGGRKVTLIGLSLTVFQTLAINFNICYYN